MFTETEIIELFQRQWPNVVDKDINYIYSNSGGISSFECILLYLYILDTRPKHIIEFSPNHGYSTFALASAQKAMRNRYSFATFEINKQYFAHTQKFISNKALGEYCEVINGDAISEVKKYIKAKFAEVDLCFIDSDHRTEFANKYIKNLFPLFQSKCLVGVHDIAGETLNIDGQSSFKTSLLGGTHKPGEENPVRKYLKDNKKSHSVLHSITGGVHEGANLPINNNLYDKVLGISGLDFRETKGPCPKTLLFRI